MSGLQLQMDSATVRSTSCGLQMRPDKSVCVGVLQGAVPAGPAVSIWC